MKRAWIVVMTACLAACSSESRPVATRAALPPGVVASVDGDLVLAETVRRIAGAQGIDRTSARELAVRDAVFAAGLRADPARAPMVAAAERAAYGRTLFEIFEEQARAPGPPTDAEVAEITAERWTELDRPPSVRTAHAVILVKKPEEAPAARALAERLAAALRGATSTADFMARAQAFPAAPHDLRAEEISPVTVDGRQWEPNARPGTRFPPLDLDYARGANALANPGDQSPLVKSAFGYHVILLEERFPERRPTLEERRALVSVDIFSRRARKLLDATVQNLRQSTPVEVERSADGLTELVAPPLGGPPPGAPLTPPSALSTRPPAGAAVVTP